MLEEGLELLREIIVGKWRVVRHREERRIERKWIMGDNKFNKTDWAKVRLSTTQVELKSLRISL